jgi:ribokinase
VTANIAKGRVDAAAIVIVGSANVDLRVSVPRLPRPGETVLARDAIRAPGGKGANQAAACAALGSATCLIARVGEDADGGWLVERMNRPRLNLAHVTRTPGTATGLAVIHVDDDAENTVAVVPGANAALAPADVLAASETVQEASVALLQLEVPQAAVEAAAELARGRVVLNPAPAQRLSRRLLGHVDVLVPNRTELAAMARCPVPRTLDEVRNAAASISFEGDLVVTLGADGAFVRTAAGSVAAVPAPVVEAVDSTGAGDAFCGALAVALANGAQTLDAAQRAAEFAAESTTRVGAQIPPTALPERTHDP